ncbi:MAG: hypothetical protein WCI97_11945 [Bacteroidota bacterium]
MKLKYHEKDIVVLKYLHETATTFERFENFLIENNLPLLERWFYYWQGMHSPKKGDKSLSIPLGYGGNYYFDFIRERGHYFELQYQWNKYIEQSKEFIDEINVVLKHILYNSISIVDFDRLLENRFLEMSVVKVRKIFESYKESDYQPLSKKDLEILFIQRGWGHVKLRIYIDSENRTDYDERSYSDNDVSGRNFIQSNYCGACDSNPCMCSDREKTSTIHDF